MAAVNVTVCPPSSSFTHLAPQFVKPNRAVAVRFAGGDRWESTGLSFDDASRCQTTTKKRFASRRLVTPSWALSNTKLQQIICGYLLQRALGRSRASVPQSMKPLELLHYAEQLLLQKVPAQERVIQRLCDEYVSMKQAGVKHPYVKNIESLIQNYDTSIIINRSAGKIVAAVVYGYYRQGLSSVGIAEATKLSPPCVRQILFRLWQIAKKLGYAVEPARQQKNSTTVFLDESTGEIVEGVRPKRAKDALAFAAGVREVDARWSAENLAAYRASKAPVEKKPVLKQDTVAVAASRAERADFVGGYRAQHIPKLRRVKVLTRTERRALGLCPYCGEQPAEGKKHCQPCLTRAISYNAPRLAAERAERAANPVPKEVWKANLSAAQTAAWERKKA